MKASRESPRSNWNSLEAKWFLVNTILFGKDCRIILLKISHKLGKEIWSIEDFLECINTRNYTRENYEFLKHDQSRPKVNKPIFLEHSLFNHNNPRKSVLCQNSGHCSDKCSIVTEVEKRKDLLRMNRMCFNRLKEGHIKENCKAKTNVLQAKRCGIIQHYATQKTKLKVMLLMEAKRIRLRV